MEEEVPDQLQYLLKWNAENDQNDLFIGNLTLNIELQRIRRQIILGKNWTLLQAKVLTPSVFHLYLMQWPTIYSEPLILNTSPEGPGI